MGDRVGQQLGNYRLTRLLGEGGFAEVYLGEHIYLKTPAAIKVLQTRVTNDDELAPFLQEAQHIASLIHPHIVRVLDFGVDGKTPFLVMDYAPHGSLRKLHPRGTRLPLSTIVSYVKQVAEALQYAHDAKLIHRDIKPENLLLGRRNDVLLSDFGIALLAQSSRYQSTQEVIGTVAYMAPEQIQGKPRQASDQYSLAIVVYEWMCGDRPFHGSFTELCAQHMFAPLPTLGETIPAISPAIDQVLTIAFCQCASLCQGAGTSLFRGGHSYTCCFSKRQYLISSSYLIAGSYSNPSIAFCTVRATSATHHSSCAIPGILDGRETSLATYTCRP